MATNSSPPKLDPASEAGRAQMQKIVGLIILLSDAGLAVGIWFARDLILGPGQEKLAAILCGALIFGGVMAYAVLTKFKAKR